MRKHRLEVCVGGAVNHAAGERGKTLMLHLERWENGPNLVCSQVYFLVREEMVARRGVPIPELRFECNMWWNWMKKMSTRSLTLFILIITSSNICCC